MKKLFLIAVASVAVAAVADSYSPTIGVTQISTTNRNTIVAVPFTSLADGGNVSVTDLVSTNGLGVGTYIYVFKDNTYKAWSLQNSGWAPVNTVAQNDEISIPSSGDDLVASPGAIWVILPTAPVAPESKTFCIYGQYTNVTESAVAVGSNLIANPLQSDATITLTGTPAVNDTLIVPNDGDPVSYIYTRRNKWVSGGVANDNLSPVIKVGQGFWYIARDGSTVSKITWAAVQNN